MGFSTFLEIVLGAIVLIPLAYVLVRACSIAWHRGKFEHFKRVEELVKGDSYGTDTAPRE